MKKNSIIVIILFSISCISCTSFKNAKNWDVEPRYTCHCQKEGNKYSLKVANLKQAFHLIYGNKGCHTVVSN